jgi:adenylate cyclase
MIVLLAVLMGLVAANLGVLAACLISLALMALYVVGDLVALDQAGLQVALATPLLAGVVTFAASTAYRVAIEQRQARALQSALAAAIPPSVAQEIARNPERVRIGGERRVLTIVFTDIKGFTSFSETIEPEVLGRIITEYLDAMTGVVFRFGGTLDKFVGDAVMAFWNAPLDDAEHAWHACQAALEMQAALARLSDRWSLEGLGRQSMRVGINTGPVSVGNMGSSQRFAYTAVGDAVNLASRLESLNDEYGTGICLSQNTLDAVGHHRETLLIRRLDLVRVKGKRQPVPVFELLGLASDASLATRYQSTLDLYAHGMLAYEAQRFMDAAELFAAAATAGGNGVDAPSVVYADRSRELAAEPPGPAWDRVYVMKHK